LGSVETIPTSCKIALKFASWSQLEKALDESEQKLILIVSLWLRAKDVAEFESYKPQAAPVLEK
jgi:hypothetical protein